MRILWTTETLVIALVTAVPISIIAPVLTRIHGPALENRRANACRPLIVVALVTILLRLRGCSVAG